MADGSLASTARGAERAVRTLAKAGCDPDVLALLMSHAGGASSSDEDRARKLSELAEFVTAIGAPAARDYFRAIQETRAVAELTDEKVLSFARSVDRHTAEWYFWAMWGTRSVHDLTRETFLGSTEFFRTIDSQATVEFFLAIRETKEVERLTRPAILEFVRSIGNDAAVEFLGALWETKAVPELTSNAVVEFANVVGRDAAREYFLAIRETKAVRELTEANVLDVIRTLGSEVAEGFFRSIRATNAARELTDNRVLAFAEAIGKDCAQEYFRVVTSTKKVTELTSERVLRASGVIRNIGSDAAIDYLLAAASSEATVGPPAAPGSGTVPVLTLLDIPRYDRLRPVALLGVSVPFWLGAWQAGSVVGGSAGFGSLALALGGWLALLGIVYLLTGALAERSTEQFLKRRRRLLNEHGIRWHDCFAGDRRCELCWTADHRHQDSRFDYGPTCRCPAC